MRTKITISIFLAILLAFFVIGVVMPKDEQSGINENRALKEMPTVSVRSVFSGEFSREFEEYLSDNVGLRSKFTSLSARINSYKGIKTNLGKIISVKKDLGAGGMSDEKTQLLVLDDRVMEIYSDNPQCEERYAAAVNKYALEFCDKANVYSMLIPTQIEFEKPIYANASDSQRDAIDRIYNMLDSSVIKVNAFDLLEENARDGIYFRTDHHWTQRGAYLGYRAFAEAAGREFTHLESLKANSRDGFLGFLYNQANEVSLADKPDKMEWFEGKQNYEFSAFAKEDGEIIKYPGKIYADSEDDVKYSLFMGGDHSFAQIDTGVSGGGVVLVIKDSYANAMIPLMANDYETVLVVDPRSYYGTIEQIVEEYNVDDILIMNYIFTTTFDDFVGKLDSICS